MPITKLLVKIKAPTQEGIEAFAAGFVRRFKRLFIFNESSKKIKKSKNTNDRTYNPKISCKYK